MIIPCDCGRSKEWEIDRVGPIAILSSRCLHCTPSGAWEPEPVEVVRKPKGRATMWPAPTDAPARKAPVERAPIAPCDTDQT